MYLVGLTGGIAAGKSTVASVWKSLGAEIIDADDLAREVVTPDSTGLKSLVGIFGDSVLHPDGSLNRKALASVVFQDDKKRKLLEQILHPLIRELSLKRIAESSSEIVVYVIPLLVESESNLPFDYIVTVEAPEGDQISRMIHSRSMTTEEATNRIRAQVSPAIRANHSDEILNSNQSLELLIADAKRLFVKISKLAKTKRDSNAV